MNYTVNKVSKISGVSIRTLHYYDEIGLLKPAFIAESGYRYYQEEQLLLLQQILFFKELGFELKYIQEILQKSDFDKSEALQRHKKTLEKKIQNMHQLITTITKTINHLEGKKSMSEQELYWGFNKEKQNEYEEYLIDQLGSRTQDLITESHRNMKSWTKNDWENLKLQSDKIYKGLSRAIDQGLEVDDYQVQELIRMHYNIIKRFYMPTKEIYSGLGQLYVEHPDFKKLYDVYHSKLAQYLADGMKLFADRELS